MTRDERIAWGVVLLLGLLMAAFGVLALLGVHGFTPNSACQR